MQNQQSTSHKPIPNTTKHIHASLSNLPERFSLSSHQMIATSQRQARDAGYVVVDSPKVLLQSRGEREEERRKPLFYWTVYWHREHRQLTLLMFHTCYSVENRCQRPFPHCSNHTETHTHTIKTQFMNPCPPQLCFGIQSEFELFNILP